MASANGAPPAAASEAVLKQSEGLPASTPVIRGYDFSNGIDYEALLGAMATTGFQASNFGRAIDEINRMLEWRLSDEPVVDDCDPEERDPAFRAATRCKIFLGFTSNLISSGVRETVRFLIQHKLVDVVVTTAGGVEEDLIKCLAPTYQGAFSLDGAALRARGLNRIGNLLVPNDNYCKFEDWVNPILDQFLAEQKETGQLWTPSKIIDRLGKEIDDPDSCWYWAHKNNIPVFCPALTDGSLGDMIYFHSFRHPGLVVDIVEDIRRMNGQAVHAAPRKTGVVILGGGLPKHHICNANLMRNGSDFAVYVNTAQEFDGSDSGASPGEAVSWGKIRANAQAVKVHGDATIVFPLLVAQTFAKEAERRKQQSSKKPSETTEDTR
ncbi:deoxyhypusine synthase [Klebsormidium nitens]|uniref:Deoxyhypusine synthase n=1 Tax=Klebsormidium nitens TaxID=105231 RepID=A0A1Y1I2D4_KLENI|nr:deoxyhypusine synthase [Klebsormidium nitens]|eukprot:GAQ84122.1 deoxyhypusine synthase [Klebsormidium nitens]